MKSSLSTENCQWIGAWASTATPLCSPQNNRQSQLPDTDTDTDTATSLSTDQPTLLFDSQNSLTADPRSFSFPFFSSFNFASTTVSSAQPAQPSPAQPLRPLLVAVAAAAAAALHCLVFAFFCYFHSAASSIDYARPIDCLLAPQRGSPDLRSQASLLGC